MLTFPHLPDRLHGLSGPAGRSVALLCVLAAVALRLPLGVAAAPAGPTRVDFNRDVRPILSDHCFACHGFDDKTRKASLRLDLKESALRGGKSGKPALVPGKPEASELVVRVLTQDADDHMPPAEFGKPLTPAQAKTLQRWIAEGGEFRDHWAFIPPERTMPPAVRHADWPRNEIDRFVLARLEEQGATPRPEADKPTLIRRATLDLTGLPPTPDEIDAYLADTSAGAYERVVDRLLASSRYGERMAVDWLDAARFADTHGYHIDSARDMTAWRDWVIRAFNDNKPFDRFTVEQLAGDLLVADRNPAPGTTDADLLVASGFNRNHMINYEGGAIPDEYHTAYILDRVNTTATVWLGLTMACAQCHDHKYDPLTMRDFYRFYAFFNTVPENGLDGRNGNAVPTLSLASADQKARLQELQEAAKKSEEAVKDLEAGSTTRQQAWEAEVLKPGGQLAGTDTAAVRTNAALMKIVGTPAESRTDEDRKKLADYFRDQAFASLKEARQVRDQARNARDKFDRSLPTTMVMGEMEKPRDTFMLVRGQYDQKGEKVPAGTPAALPPLADGDPVNRLGLARWLVSPQQPLTARVIVNRYWQMYFGQGLVKSAENFGSQGDWPAHPALLDWLATEFVDSGWNVKAMQRLIVTSATYRQSSAAPRTLVESDPENRMLARGPRVRLQAEFIRDLALQVSGLLDPRVGGESVFPYQPAGMWEELMAREDNDAFTAQKYVTSHGRDLYRRTMYTFWKRTCAPPSLGTFDAPDRQVCTVRRARTTTPLQALVLMNDPTYVEASRKLAERMMASASDESGRIAHAFRLATGRNPRSAETEILIRLYRSQLETFRADASAADRLLGVGDAPRAAGLDAAELGAWTVVASAILNLDETITKG